MNTSPIHTTAGYYRMTMSSLDTRMLLRSNNERSFVLSQLQDLLCARSVLEAPVPQRHLASHIDLLAYSIQDRDICLLVFTISPSSLHELSREISRRLQQYQSEYAQKPVQDPVCMLVRLAGPHHALSASTTLHLRHTDWEYDRYSSIGFFLHDRRGDWMRLWRIAQLYDTQPKNYRLLITNELGTENSTSKAQTTHQQGLALTDEKSGSLSRE